MNGLKYCNKCGRPLPENEKINHCQICGAKIENKLSFDNTNSLLRQNVNMDIYINNSHVQEQQNDQKNTNEVPLDDSKTHIASEKANGLKEEVVLQHPVKEQVVQEEQPELDLSGLLDSLDTETDELVVEEQDVQEKQPELDLSGLLDSSNDKTDEPVVEEQEVQEEQPELDLSGLLDSSDAEVEESVEDVNIQVEEIEEYRRNLDETITTEQDEVIVNEAPDENKQDVTESLEVTDDKRANGMQNDIKHYEPRIDFSDIDPMFGEAPTFDAEAIQRAYNESKKNKKISNVQKTKKLFGK